MTDINKQIEEARGLLECIIQNPNSTIGSKEFDLIETSSRLLYLALHSSRWRKVSEELPEVKDENYFINVKRYDNEFRIDTICVFAEMEDVKGYLEFNNVDSWKPID